MAGGAAAPAAAGCMAGACAGAVGVVVGAAGGVVIGAGAVGVRGVITGAALPALLVVGVPAGAVVTGALLPAAGAPRPAVLVGEPWELGGASLAQPLATALRVSTNSDQRNGGCLMGSAASRVVLGVIGCHLSVLTIAQQEPLKSGLQDPASTISIRSG